MIRDQMRARWWDQRCQLLDEGERFEHDTRRAVRPGVAQVVGDAPIGKLGESLGRDRRTRHVAAEPLESRPIRAGNAHTCVQREAIVHCAVRSGRLRERRAGPVTAADARDALASARPERQSPLDRRGLRGRVLGLGDLWFDAVVRSVQRNVFTEVWKSLEIAPAIMGSRSGAYGAAHLAAQRNEPNARR